MANYDVSIKLAIAGARQLDKVNKQTDKLRASINAVNKTAELSGKKPVRNFKNLSQAVTDARDALDEAAIGTKEFNQAIKNVVKVEDKFNRQQKIKERALKVEQLRVKEGITLKEAKIRITQEEIELENKLAIARQKSANAERQRAITRGITSGIGSGIIGAGFPLLFGQGPTAALGGGLGGLAGGAMSAIPGMGQFGFALSIAGTTIGSSLDELTKALNKPTENIQTLVNRLGLVGTETGDLALELEKLGLKSSAAELLLNEFEKEFGLSADQIKENSEKMTEFNNQINQLGTSVTLLLSDALGPLIDKLNSFMKGGKAEGTIRNITGIIDFFTANAFDLDRRGGILSELPPLPGQKSKRPLGNIPAAEGKAVIGGVKLNPNFGMPSNISLADPNKAAIDQAKFEQQILPLQQALEIEEKRLNTSDEKLQLMQEEFKLTNLQNDLDRLNLDNKKNENGLHDDAINKLQAQVNLQEQVVANAEALVDPMRQVSNIMAQDMGNALKGLIQGTQTLNEALRNVLNNMANSFLNLGIFGNVAGVFTPGEGLLGSIFPKANGGPVKGGGSYIVGEKGPELFTPGVSGMVTPNHALGGSTNVVVNVDASGSAVQGDDDNAAKLGEVIASAVQAEIVNQQMAGGLLS